MLRLYIAYLVPVEVFGSENRFSERASTKKTEVLLWY